MSMALERVDDLWSARADPSALQLLMAEFASDRTLSVQSDGDTVQTPNESKPGPEPKGIDDPGPGGRPAPLPSA
jgi:hypothetical protein